MLDQLIEAEQRYLTENSPPTFIVLGKNQIKIIEDLVNSFWLENSKKIDFGENYGNNAKWHGMVIKKSNKEDYIGFY